LSNLETRPFLVTTTTTILIVRISDLLRHGAPPPLVKVWAELATELTEIQEKAAEAGALDGKSNLLVVAPTSSGKTLVGEFAATSSAYKTRRHGIFLVPFRALADEHFANFRSRYGDLLSVVISTSDWTEYDDDIRSGNFGLAVMTYEKFVSLLVDHPQLLDRCSVLVVDEVQLLGDRARGSTLEMLLTQVLLRELRPQLIGLSASLDRLNRLDDWLQAALVISNERPVPLRETVLAPRQGLLLGTDDSEEQVIAGNVDRDDAVAGLVSGLVADGKQVLLFRSSIANTQKTAERLKRHLPAKGVPPTTLALLDDLEPSEAVESLRRALASGVGFHNADLTAPERRAVEQAFRSGDARVLVATTTLAMGVNLPTDVVVIGDYKRWFFNRGSFDFEEISVAEYKNATGRAGRLGQRSAGEAILVADKDVERRQLLDFYCRGEVEPVESQLARQDFDDVVFNVVAGGLASDVDGLVEFISATFAYLTFYETSGGRASVKEGVERAVAACRESGLIREEDGQLLPTRSALVFARFGVPLATAARLVELADRLVDGAIAKEELLFEVSACDGVFGGRPYSEWDKLRRQPKDPRPTAGLVPSAFSADSPLRVLLGKGQLDEAEARVILRTACLLEWLDGGDEAELARRYKGCPSSRLRGMGKTAAWLLEALEQVIEIRGAAGDEIETVSALALECRYGVPVALAPLAQLNATGVGRVALLGLYAGDGGRQLYEPDVLLNADAEEFEGLLTPAELAQLRAAIVAERGETLRRRRNGHIERAEQAALDAQVVDDLYRLGGAALEQAVVDALDAVGVGATRNVRQSSAEEDLRISHNEGTIVVSVTASKSHGKRVAWNKAREVLSTGVGLNPLSYVCIARPGFHSLAERQAHEIAREQGARRLLLVPIDVLAEAIVRIREGRLDSTLFVDLLAQSGGLLRFRDLPTIETATVESTQGASAEL
jgi:replicative superfamily II helicase